MVLCTRLWLAVVVVVLLVSLMRAAWARPPVVISLYQSRGASSVLKAVGKAKPRSHQTSFLVLRRTAHIRNPSGRGRFARCTPSFFHFFLSGYLGPRTSTSPPVYRSLGGAGVFPEGTAPSKSNIDHEEKKKKVAINHMWYLGLGSLHWSCTLRYRPHSQRPREPLECLATGSGSPPLSLFLSFSPRTTIILFLTHKDRLKHRHRSPDPLPSGLIPKTDSPAYWHRRGRQISPLCRPPFRPPNCPAIALLQRTNAPFTPHPGLPMQAICTHADEKRYLRRELGVSLRSAGSRDGA